jgi:hypothetical protein
MTSHFDRYENIKPKAFASVEEYNAFYKHVNGANKKETLVNEANRAIAWGCPDTESYGYTPQQFVALIQKLRDYIVKNT